ncbi:MAG: DUF763 domain-containing protein [Treponema sp.]|nr:DUF763 domain-containing protein [Treponema sp.]
MLRRQGHADLPLHTGTVPKWLSDRMMALGTEIIEALLINYGKREVLRRLSDPLWFQSLGAVLGMDWHSSGITTSVMYALKRGINARAHEFGLCICGGRGKYSRQTPEQIEWLCDKTGMDSKELVRASRLSAKIDNTAVQDGFQLYQHNFIVTDEGDWAVVQQGMNTKTKTARRYHWCSDTIKSFVEEPHTAVTGENTGKILNLTDRAAESTRGGILTLSREEPERILRELCKISGADIARQGELFTDESAPVPAAHTPAWQNNIIITENKRTITMPAHHEVRKEDVDIQRLGAVLATAYADGDTESDSSHTKDFESLLLTPGLGPRTLQSLTLVSEVIYGTPSRFTDPARFSFAHGGKDGHPFPVPTRIYDETIRVLGESIEKSKLGYTEKSECIRRLHRTALQIESACEPEADFDAVIAREREHSHDWGGMTCSGAV